MTQVGDSKDGVGGVRGRCRDGFRMRVDSRDTMLCIFFFQAEDGIRDLVRSRGLGDVYKRQALGRPSLARVP